MTLFSIHVRINFKAYFDRKNSDNKGLVERTYRLLVKHKHKKYSNIIWTKDKIPNHEEYPKKYTFNNEKVCKDKNKYPNKRLLRNSGRHEQSRKCKYSTCTERQKHFKKRILDKIYYKNKLWNTTNSDFSFLRNSIKLKQNVLYTLPFFPIIVGIILAVIIFLKYIPNTYSNEISFFWYDLTMIGFSIFSFIFIIVMIYIFKIIVKNVKLLHKKHELHNTAYSSAHKVISYGNKNL
ncbi:Plasmodium exported protein, unknown function [Plasmodium malariae]|uniref:Uncharacterized protein n=1 Tax=Plasmodium malariae TaxID=5858 RepID=A0A1D3JHD1_PLAMA|nr:Plasmodium exported protein, unknown function [Plasmodium malariae]SBT85598.1 Plasmodium exported protein, unknown function [Plasmodium malariae]